MSVYTSLNHQEVAEFIAQFDLGTFISHKGIAAGIENTNYFVTTSTGEYVLTLFEHHYTDEVRDFVRLARHLGRRGLNVPAPLVDHSDVWLHNLKNKPAILCQRLPGEHIADPQPAHCFAIGKALAEMHLAADDLHPRRADTRGFDWWINIGPEVKSDLSAQEQAVLDEELVYQQAHREQWLTLPQGWIHGDLFHDNALFDTSAEQPAASAILDLYNACEGTWLYDLAIIANDWCCDSSGEWKAGCTEALHQGYSSVRALSDAELTNWNLVLRGAALRFWLSRLLTRRIQQQTGGEMALQKDPAEFMNKLLVRRSAEH